jgi:hypothetical protein
LRIEPPFALIAPECICPIERFSEIGLFFAWDIPFAECPGGSELARDSGESAM